MSQYIVIERISVQNANCIAGFTWGFPAITHFLGFMHHMERQVSESFGVTLEGCAVVCHDSQVQAYQSKSGRDFEFIQSKNPPYLPRHDPSADAPIIEEGRMNMTVSLIIKLGREFAGNSEAKNDLENKITELCQFGRLAGGTILDFKSIELKTLRNAKETSQFLRKTKRKLMPGFVLQGRAELLEQHFVQLKQANPETELLDAWLDFSALKYRAIPKPTGANDIPDENTAAEWQRCARPLAKGWLVPLMVGYKAISPLYKPGEVANVRDETVPACFVEAVHSIGEWQSLHRLANIDSAIWYYSMNEGWYLCKQKPESQTKTPQEAISNQKISFGDLLANI